MSENRNTLSHTINGHGNVVVLLHGFLETKEMWDILELEKNFQIVAIDLPGHGLSNIVDKENVSIESMADRVLETLAELTIQKFHLVGHSMGGYVALEILERSKKVDKIILLHSNFWQDDTKKKQDRLRVAQIVSINPSLFVKEALPALFVEPQAHKKFIDIAISQALKMSGEEIAYSAMAMRDRKDFSDFVNRKKERILIIQGELDKTVPLELMREKAEGLCLEVIQCCGHMGHIEATAEIRASILKFLA